MNKCKHDHIFNWNKVQNCTENPGCSQNYETIQFSFVDGVVQCFMIHRNKIKPLFKLENHKCTTNNIKNHKEKKKPIHFSTWKTLQPNPQKHQILFI